MSALIRFLTHDATDTYGFWLCIPLATHPRYSTPLWATYAPQRLISIPFVSSSAQSAHETDGWIKVQWFLWHTIETNDQVKS